MPDPTTPAKGLTQPTVGADDNVWGGLLNTDLSLIDSALGGTLTLSISGNTTLTGTQAQNTGYQFSGILSALVTITWPSFFGLAVIANNTNWPGRNGGYPISCGISGGISVLVESGETVPIWSDGTNFYRLTQFGGGANAFPFATVTAFGAIGDGNTDDTTAVQAAIDYVSNLYAAGNGGIVYFPPGEYYIASGITLSGRIRLVGASTVSTQLTTNGNDIVLVNVTSPSQGCSIENMQLAGGQILSPGSPPVHSTLVVTGGDSFRVFQCQVYYGKHCVEAYSGDFFFQNSAVANAYGNANFYIGTSGGHNNNNTWASNSSFDQSPPVQGFLSQTTINNWAASTNYSLGEYVFLTTGWTLQCSTAGTSGSTQPLVQSYGAAITDGTAVWKLLSNSSLAMIQLDSGLQECYFTQCDISATACNYGVYITTTGADPFFISFDQCDFGGSIMGALRNTNSCEVRITNCEIGLGWSGGQGIIINGSAPMTISNNEFFLGNPTTTNIGINIQSPTNTIVNGNKFDFNDVSSSTGVAINTGVENVIVTSNIFIGCGMGVDIGTGCDFFTVANNLVNTCTTGISNGSSGATHSTVSNNSGDASVTTGDLDITAGNLTVHGSTTTNNIVVDAAPTAAWNLDGSGATTTIANGSSAALPAGQGLVLMTDSSGHTALFLVFAGGGSTLIAGNSGVFVASNTPSSGFTGLAMNVGGTAYTIFNNTGSSQTYSVVLIRSGASN